MKRLSPLCRAYASALVVRHTFFAVTADNMLIHFEFNPQMSSKYFDTQLKSAQEPFEAEIILMEPRHIGLLYKERQIICVFLLDNPKFVKIMLVVY